MIDTLIAGIVIPLAPSYGGNGYYDPVHQICQPYLPAAPQPGYDQTCSGGYYDPQHGVCAPYEPAYPPPFYHRHDNAPGGPPGESAATNRTSAEPVEDHRLAGLRALPDAT